ncbi:beta-glucosidase 12-like [Pyrus ussuriensis x Pyrus communis]|uniref:Beta-glucosidase 12-like n=1 Tax=Pyrus ussuriensis x Pyrus communis TaxID=2448454 RepID=A0A5N5FWT3_9ROSA|nr:beta-glucosidase 12-like [Pyrus ussuriensis x Pyrus communis]
MQYAGKRQTYPTSPNTFQLLMAMKLGSLFLFVVLLTDFALTNSKAANTDPPIVCDSLNRSSFDSLVPGFIFGTSSAAYQVEGAWNESGRGPSVWDNFTHQYPEKISDHSNGDVAIDQYHLYQDDVKIMKNMSMDAYRFSISWSRLLPSGTLSGGINKEGIEYYNNLTNELLSNGIKPFVTLFHWDVPQALVDEYGGFLSARIVNDFQDFADLCFDQFGDRVKHWITLNEPRTVSNHGYAIGIHAPGRCSAWYNPNCTGGDSSTEPYIVTHNQLLAHATAVKLYKDKYQACQNGTIGITVVSYWFEPASETQWDRDAALRALDFMFGWFMDPLTHGDYPQTMRAIVGERLPSFTKEQSELLSGSYDFIGLNYYSARYASVASYNCSDNPSYVTDPRVNVTTELDGVPIGPQAASDWLYVYPKGIQDFLLYTKEKYNDPLIYITENGVDEFNDPTLPLPEALNDTNRIDYYNRHLCYVQAAIKNGTNVKGYFAWSVLDNFEWSDIYTVRFGIIYVDYESLQRSSKSSTYWFQSFLKKSSNNTEEIKSFVDGGVGNTEFVYQI